MTSDARPPSDTGTTGWHRHVLNGAVHAENPGMICTADLARPVLVVDPAEARDGAEAEVVALTGCSPTLAKAVVTRVLAALAGQGQP